MLDNSSFKIISGRLETLLTLPATSSLCRTPLTCRIQLAASSA